MAKVSKASSNQEASESLQRSITDLLAVINQVARGDLTLRGKVTNDALGNVSDSINYMLDNFTKVLERVRKAAMEVAVSANNILLAADEMQAGATQQDQEITNTSSAVEELTVSMKQVSNNAEASAEAARRALDAAEQGNRAVRDTLLGRISPDSHWVAYVSDRTGRMEVYVTPFPTAGAQIQVSTTGGRFPPGARMARSSFISPLIRI